MNPDELITHARSELKSLPLSKIGMTLQDLSQERIFGAQFGAIVRFSCPNRDEIYDLVLDRRNGREIGSTLDLKPLQVTPILSDSELLLKAKEILNSKLRHPLFKIGVEPQEFTEARILDAPVVVIRFGDENRDTVEVLLNAETGESAGVTHIPYNTRKRSR